MICQRHILRLEIRRSIRYNRVYLTKGLKYFIALITLRLIFNNATSTTLYIIPVYKEIQAGEHVINCKRLISQYERRGKLGDNGNSNKKNNTFTD